MGLFSSKKRRRRSDNGPIGPGRSAQTGPRRSSGSPKTVGKNTPSRSDKIRAASEGIKKREQRRNSAAAQDWNVPGSYAVIERPKAHTPKKVTGKLPRAALAPSAPSPLSHTRVSSETLYARNAQRRKKRNSPAMALDAPCSERPDPKKAAEARHRPKAGSGSGYKPEPRRWCR